MKTIEYIQLTEHTKAHIYERNDGGYYVAIEQTYHDETDVLTAKCYKTMSGVTKFVESWR